MFPQIEDSTSLLRSFTPTALQFEATRLMTEHMYVLLVGGRRSGKTFVTIYNIFLRALHTKSTHLVFRLRFSHAKRSIWHDTLPKVFKICFPDLVEGTHYILNKSDWYIKFLANGSTIWLGGLDDKERTEKILGTEYSTIYYNESSQIDFKQFEMGLSGLAENSGLDLCCWIDCNPPSKKHWTYRMFVEMIHPGSGRKLSPTQYGWLRMNPADNRDNLPPSYFDILDNLSKRERDRFRDGAFLSEVEGALWNQKMISSTITCDKEVTEFNDLLTVVSVDPTVSSQTSTNDECGIIIGSKDQLSCNREGHVLVQADRSGHYTAKEWPHKVVKAYHDYSANYILAESNNGGDLVKSVIHHIDPFIKVKLVHASKGKFARAEPVTVVYENQKVLHAPGLNLLEEQLMEYIPETAKYSPGRLDANVWLMTEFFGMAKPPKKPIRVRFL